MNTRESDEKMNLSGRRWGRFLAGLLAAGLVLVACSRVPEESDVAPVDTLPSERVAMAGVDGVNAAPSDRPLTYLTINVDLTDDGFEPSSIFIPAGRGVRLVVRNRGTTEHHYRVVGLVPEGLLWLSEPAGEREAGVTDEEHVLHHSSTFVPFRSTSNAGIRPFGDEVHAYAARNDVDMVLFTATNRGTFLVECPLHPEATGKVHVF